MRIGLGRYAQDLHGRIALNHVAMRNVHSSNALLFGIGKYFTEVPAYPPADFSTNPIWVGVAAGRVITNHSGTEEALSFFLEAQRYRGPGAASIAAFVEGDDGSRVDRRGIAAQGWLIQPLTDKWAVSVGVGPYVARNARDSGNARVLGLITMQADRSISSTVKVFGSFSRVKTFTEKNDRDLFQIGVMKHFGG